MKLKDKTVVVTGGGSGIGRELVRALLARGARVAAVDLSQEGLDETAAQMDAGDRLSLHVANIADRARVQGLPDEVIDHHGAVDVLINNAGVIQPFVPLNDLDYKVIERMINVNLYGTIYMVKAFLPHLLQRPAGHIANVSSMGGFLPVPGQTMYGAAKAAVKLMTEGLYTELIDTNVNVSVIMPGAINTNIMHNSGIDREPASEADMANTTSAPDAARIILEGIEANQLHVLVGKDAKFMFLASRAAPKKAALMIQKQMKKHGVGQ